jgi:AraC family transcriptional regulator
VAAEAAVVTDLASASLRQWDQSFSSHGTFYQEVYGHAIRQIDMVGRLGMTIGEAAQTAGDWSDAATPDLVVSKLLSGFNGVVDCGGGRRQEPGARNEFVVIPSSFATTILSESPHEIRFVALPYEGLRQLAGDEADLPRDGDFGPVHDSFQQDRDVSALLDRIMREAGADSPCGPLWFDAAALQLAATLLRLAARPSAQRRVSLAPWQVRRATEYLMDNLARDVSLCEVAAVARLSPFHFNRAFKRSLGVTPAQWQLQRRIEHAQTLMLDHEASLLQVALAVGYQSQGAFGNAFRRVTGDTPAAWRRKRLD